MSTETLAGGAPVADATPTPPAAGAPPAPVSTSGAPPASEPGATPPATPPAATPPAAAPGAPRPPAASPAAGTLAGGAAADTPPADATPPVEPSWPEDWRARTAGDDAELLKRLEAFDSPSALAKRLQEVEAGLPPKLPENATDEQVAEFRKAAGIPETAEGYEINPTNGYVFGELDKPALDSFKAFAHANNWTPDQVAQGGEWYAGMQEQLASAQAEQDVEFKTATETELRKEWGPEFKRNLSVVQNFLASHAPDGLADRLLAGRSADGRKLGDDPAMLAFLVKAAKEANPAASVMPSGTPPSATAIADELAGLRKLMGDRRSAYWQGPDRDRHQARYRELIEASQPATKRG